jgi:hypothetical protein
VRPDGAGWPRLLHKTYCTSVDRRQLGECAINWHAKKRMLHRRVHLRSNAFDQLSGTLCACKHAIAFWVGTQLWQDAVCLLVCLLQARPAAGVPGHKPRRQVGGTQFALAKREGLMNACGSCNVHCCSWHALTFDCGDAEVKGVLWYVECCAVCRPKGASSLAAVSVLCSWGLQFLCPAAIHVNNFWPHTLALLCTCALFAGCLMWAVAVAS